MTKCGKSFLPECEYFTTGGCISPFNCPYKIEEGYINSATSFSTYIEQCNGMSNGDIERLKAENAELRETLSKMETVEKELRERLDKAVILPMLQVVKGNRRPYELVYKDQNGRVIISKYRPYDKYEAEARLAELKGGKE